MDLNPIKKDLIKNTDLIEQVIESINSQINAGKLDKEIKDKYKNYEDFYSENKTLIYKSILNVFEEFKTTSKENLTFYNSWKPSEQNFGAIDIVSDIEYYRSLLQVAEAADDLEFYNKEKAKFNTFNKMFDRFGRKME